MLNLAGRTRIVQSREFPVITGSVINAEGLALVQVFENNVEKIKPSEGAAGEKFLGFSYGEVFTPRVKSKVELLNVPAAAPYVVTLPFEPLAGQLLVYNETGAAEVSEGDPTVNAGEYSILGRIVTFNAAQAGASIRFQFRYTPPTEDIIYEDRVMITTFSATEFMSSIGCILQGEVMTDQFDSSVDWSAATGVKLGPGGVVTDQNGAGEEIDAMIIAFPNSENPYLGLRY
jgi:hypothetical protein